MPLQQVRMKYDPPTNKEIIGVLSKCGLQVEDRHAQECSNFCRNVSDERNYNVTIANALLKADAYASMNPNVLSTNGKRIVNLTRAVGVNTCKIPQCDGRKCRSRTLLGNKDGKLCIC